MSSSRVGRQTSIKMQKYMLSESDHINRIKEYRLRELVERLTVGAVCGWQWTTLAGKLGITNDEVDRITAYKCDSPAYEVLRCWRLKPKSTVRVLRQVLMEMKRDDVVEMLDEFRLNKVHLTIVVQSTSLELDEIVLSGKCPARQPLVEYVRPQLARCLTLQLIEHREKLIVTLPSLPPSVSWTSTAEQFEGQELKLEMTKVSDMVNARSLSQPSRRRHSIQYDIYQGKNYISYVEDDSLIFGYSDGKPQAEPSSPEPSDDPASPSSISSDQSEESLTSIMMDDVTIFENPEPDEWTEAKALEGFSHIEGSQHRTQVEEILRPFLKENGRYLIRTSRTHAHVKLALSVVSNGAIRNFYIYSQRVPGSRTGIAYTLYVELLGYRWESLQSLIAHYCRHPLENFTGPDGTVSQLVLTKPVPRPRIS